MTDGNKFDYVYNYKDHLGNVRLSYCDLDKNGVLGNEKIKICGDPDPETGLVNCTTSFVSPIVEESHYYPFGLQHSGYLYGSVQPNYQYKYNGKEYQDELNLNLYDYGARNYDPAIGRFLKIDRFAEKYSERNPYNYAANNPVYFVEIAGDSINVSALLKNKEGLHVLSNILFDLNEISGMNFSVNSSGNLTATDGEKDGNGNMTGSASARTYLRKIIGDKKDNITVENDNTKSTHALGRGKININSNQIDDNIFSAESAGLGELTYGYGTSFIHESLHTRTGTFALNPQATSLYDDDVSKNPIGPTETMVNLFRREINLPQRVQYNWTKFTTSSPATMQFLNTNGKKVTVTQQQMPQLDKEVRRSK